MHLRELQRNWDAFGTSDPMWAILTEPSKSGNRWNADEFFATGVAEIAEVMRWVNAIHPLRSRVRALDFGCGVGRLTQPLAEYFQESVGVDLAPSMIRQAEQYNRYGKRCRYVLNEEAGLRCFEDGTFDFIYSGLTLQHMAPRYARAYLAEFTRLLGPDGLLVFRLPSEPAHKKQMLQARRWLAEMLYVHLYCALFRRSEPLMQMYGIKRERILQLLGEKGCEALVVEPDTSAGLAWISYRYFVVHQGHSGGANRVG